MQHKCGSPPQKNELLTIVETLKDFKNILLGQDIKVYTDHKISHTRHITQLGLCVEDLP